MTHIDKNTGRPWYNTVIVVKTESGIDTVDEIKGKRFGFVSQSSPQIPCSQRPFPRPGIDPKTDFAAVEYAGGHDKNVSALVAGTVDAIAVTKATYLDSQESGQLPYKAIK